MARQSGNWHIHPCSDTCKQVQHKEQQEREKKQSHRGVNAEEQ
jgi:hypothetical protein